jgi:hypothetical protein
VTICPAARGWDWAELLQDVDFSLHRYERRHDKNGKSKSALPTPLTCRVKKGRESEKRELVPAEKAAGDDGEDDRALQVSCC